MFSSRLRSGFLTIVITVISALPASGTATAEHAEKATGPIILTVAGSIGGTDSSGAAEFDREGLAEIGWREVTSYTDWTEGPQKFSGVPLQALLDHVGAKGDTLLAEALNDYAIRLPISDAARYDVLLAMKNNGEWMRIRDKGPIWIIYPEDTQMSGNRGAHNDKMVWQLRRLTVE